MARMKALPTIETEITQTEEDFPKSKRNMIPWPKNSSRYRKKSRDMKPDRLWEPIKEATGTLRKR